MPEEFSWDGSLTNRIAIQSNRIVRAFAGQGVTVKVIPDGRGGVAYMYAEHDLLVRDQNLRDVLEILGGPPADVERIVPGVTRVILDRDSELLVADLLERIDQDLGVGVATPNHVLTVAPAGPCPATEPEPAYFETEPYPSVCTGNSGTGVTVFVADTGLLEDAENQVPWLRHARRADNPGGGVQPPDPLGPPALDGTPTIPYYAGHGTFVAAEVCCLAPQADVIVANVFQVAGSTLEADLVQQLDQALALGVDVFNLSITCGTRLMLRSLGFDGFLRRLRDYKGVVCVAAAGNDSSNLIRWPAGFSEVVSVGALGSDWRGRARFTNYGSWVDVYAPGRDLVNAFATGRYTCSEPPYENQTRNFYGMARWSGTSFSTPIVTGLIAARMSRTGESGQQAAAGLMAEARTQAVPGIGPILLPPDGYGPVPRPASVR